MAADRPTGPPPALSVGIELARTLGETLVFPLRFLSFLLRKRGQVEGVRGDLATCATPREMRAETLQLPRRPLEVFVSCAEVSGEVHALNLLASMRERLASIGAPEPRVSGLGGPRLAEAGVEIIGDPVSRAGMGMMNSLSNLGFYLGLLRDACTRLRERPHDVCVAVDSPSLHVPLARIARRTGTPVVHFVAPQYWAWGPWRSGAYRGAVDRVLTILPFEPSWFARHGIEPVHVGHPLLDELANVPATRPEVRSNVLVLLPGSRRRVIDLNLPWMLAEAERLRQEAPELEVVVPHRRDEMRPLMEGHIEAAGAAGWARIETGDLHGILSRARAALSVSGTILIDLVHRRLPAVVVYRVRGASALAIYNAMSTAPHFSSVNLLAGRELLPEFAIPREGPLETVSEALLRCYKDEAWRAQCIEGLGEVADRLGPPGAIARAADQVLELAGRGALRRAR